MKKFPFLENEVIIDTTNYPLLNGYHIAAKKPVKISNNFTINNLHEGIALELEMFLKEKSLKDALKKAFNISSSAVTEFTNKLMFTEKKDCVEVNLNYWLILDILSTLFLKQEKPNHSDFLKFLEQFQTDRRILSLLAPYYNFKLQIQKLLNNNFTEAQKCELLQNSSSKDELKDTLAMYMQNDEYLDNVLSMKQFKDVNSIQKIHDVFSKENAKLKSKDFDLKQENWYPNILKLNDEDHSTKLFHFMIPKSHHTLIDWGTTLGHCIGSKHYSTEANMGRCLLLGIGKSADKVDYTMEIKSGRMVQIQGVAGTRPQADVSRELEKILRKLELLH